MDQKSFVLDNVGEDWTMKQIKEAIQKTKNNDPTLDPSVSKLIWKGKILKNDQIAKDCNVNEKGFFVVMPGKAVKSQSIVEETPKVSNKKESTQSSTGPSVPDQSQPIQGISTDPQGLSTPAPAVTTTQQQSPIPAGGTTATSAATPTPRTPVVPINFDDILNSMPVDDGMISTVSGFGFPTDKAKLALQVAQGNPDVAVELLFSNGLDAAVAAFKQQMQGMSASLLRGESPSTGANTSGNTGGETENITQNTTSSTAETANTEDEEEINRQLAASVNPLAYLTENETFLRMIEHIRSNPDTLPGVMAQIRTGNPDLFNQINNNHEAFLNLINNDGSNPSGEASRQSSNTPAGAGGASADGQRSNRVEVAISASDREAINRLMVLGFSEVEAAQAYLACEKNEEAAANLLFDSM